MGTRVRGNGGGSCVQSRYRSADAIAKTDILEVKGFRLISWNIEGLANGSCGDTEAEITLRTQVAMRELLEQAPTLICLQEVIAHTLPTIEKMLGRHYLDVEGPSAGVPGSYFTKMYARRGQTVQACCRQAFSAGSRQGRDLLLVTLAHNGVKVCVATSHLESERDNLEVRQRQLSESLQRTKSHAVQQGASLYMLVGDLNLGSKDEQQVKTVTNGWTDALPKIGGKFAHTWCARTNKRVQVMTGGKENFGCRFDRCFFVKEGGHVGQANGWRFRGGSLIGTRASDLLEHGFASDHYGLHLAWEHPAAFGDFLHDSGGGGGGGLAGGRGFLLGGSAGEGHLLGGDAGPAASRAREAQSRKGRGEGDGAAGSARAPEEPRQMAALAAQVCFVECRSNRGCIIFIICAYTYTVHP
jgi:exonuclease III